MTAKRFSELSIKQICTLAQVARAGYYRWLKYGLTTPKQRFDQRLMQILRKLYNENQGKCGYRSLTMIVNRRYHRHYNRKRIRRLLVAMGLRAVIRRAKKSCTISKGHNFEPNLLNRNFNANRLNQKWVTDVTYLEYGNQCRAYLSAIKDLYNGEIISYVVSTKNDNPLVMKTLEQAMRKYPGAHPLLHSDRGFQYTSNQFARLTAKYGITRSMSRVGRCIDNAPMESFWGHYKDEAYKGEHFNSYEELVASIDRYIYYYNHKRYQEKLNSLTPVEYRHQAA